MKFVGAALIVVGVIIQWNERRTAKAHVWLTNALEEHIRRLNQGRLSTEQLPESGERVPGGDLSFAEIKGIVAGAEEKASQMTETQLREVIEDFERKERKQEPIYIASYVLIGLGTILTVF